MLHHALFGRRSDATRESSSSIRGCLGYVAHEVLLWPRVLSRSLPQRLLQTRPVCQSRKIPRAEQFQGIPKGKHTARRDSYKHFRGFANVVRRSCRSTLRTAAVVTWIKVKSNASRAIPQSHRPGVWRATRWVQSIQRRLIYMYRDRTHVSVGYVALGGNALVFRGLRLLTFAGSRS